MFKTAADIAYGVLEKLAMNITKFIRTAPAEDVISHVKQLDGAMGIKGNRVFSFGRNSKATEAYIEHLKGQPLTPEGREEIVKAVRSRTNAGLRGTEEDLAWMRDNLEDVRGNAESLRDAAALKKALKDPEAEWTTFVHGGKIEDLENMLRYGPSGIANEPRAAGLSGKLARRGLYTYDAGASPKAREGAAAYARSTRLSPVTARVGHEIGGVEKPGVLQFELPKGAGRQQGGSDESFIPDEMWRHIRNAKVTPV